jgi:RNA polymerase sigma factor (sigma-70 family)
MRGWLYRVLKNRHIDHVRKLKRHPHASLDEFHQTEQPLADRLPDRSLSPSALLERKALQKDVRSALQALPDEYRIPVTLCDIEEQTYDQIAATLNCPIGTVRSRIHRGRLALRDQLKLKRWWVPAAALLLAWGWYASHVRRDALRMTTPPEIVKTQAEKVVAWHPRDTSGVN